MLFAVGGGFFSSSASGYSKGISLLLLGQKDEEEKQMKKISPWNHHHYQLVDQDSKHPADLASSGKNHLAQRCASFVCFRTTSGAAKPDNSSGQKMGQTQNMLDGSGKGKGGIRKNEGNDDNVQEIPLKSNLKKPSTRFPVPCRIGDEHEEDGNLGRRKVRWMDVSGGELVNIREYEPSEDEMSDGDEFEFVNEKTCVCRIM